MKLWKTFNIQKREEISYYNTSEGFDADRFAIDLGRLIDNEMALKGKSGVMYLCIGTDRSTGDSLGPLIGHKLLWAGEPCSRGWECPRSWKR